MEDSPIESDMYTRIGNNPPNASVLPQPQTLYTGGAAPTAASPTSNRPGLRLSFANTASAIANVFAHGPSSASPPFSSNTKSMSFSLLIN